MKVALLVDRLSVTRWQAEAIKRLGGDVELIVYNCTSPPLPRRRFRHFAYYLLNIVSLRGGITRAVSLADWTKAAPSVDFEYEMDGAWLKLPAKVVDHISSVRPVAIVKFSSGLLRVPVDLSPILSYHHGDPRRFRGRPAGFYELLRGEKVIGQIVQVLSNRLDAGKVVAFAETPLRPHSYRSTMQTAYATSPLLLRKALNTIAEHKSLAIDPDGPVTRLPSTSTVLRFALQRLKEKLKRLAYGALVEKQWQVAETNLRFAAPPFLKQFPRQSAWQVLDRPKGYRFLADPFPSPSGSGVLVEALRSSTGLGEIVEIDGDRSRALLRGEGHYSYPATFNANGSLLVPEICEWSGPRLYRLNGEGAQSLGALKLATPRRLVDPTLVDHGGSLYLFANDFAEGDFVLRLWTADDIEGTFQEHPASPVLISPCGGRMGGLLIDQGGLYRVGQDNSGQYGDGVLLFRVEELSRDIYRETLVDRLRFSEVHGPHTLNFTSNGVLFDFYRHQFSPLSGLRRLRGRLASRRSSQASSASYIAS